MPQHASPFRLLRSAAIGATILSLAAAAHVLAGGMLPDPLILAALAALTGLVSTVATRIRVSLPAMLGLLGAGQLALHQGFDLLSGGTGPSVPMPALHDHSLSAAAQTAAAFQQATAAGMAGPAMSATTMADHGGGFAMTAAHALATVATAVVLARGEAALWALAQWLRPLLTPAADVVRPLPLAHALPVPGTVAVPRPWRYLRSHSRRGPPAAAALFA
ncbi:hypothetical protein ACQCSX_16320 [Pseudarthrobacter sp. P1]|uniref:hypothetical protein n=1 Tax=Pseudarthrobacter sp. P1 TaxID=3418418 RepID=UPI003CF32B89